MCQDKVLSYFITFTDDYSHYGYVYLLKHKHEVFEMFKVFKNEVENQLGKTIKALRSDRGGEYISQEFKDYLKACGIVQQLTPPYTPQHTCVSERRNQSATSILNMVPTKKVGKTPYELWAIGILISIMAFYDYEIWQMDVKIIGNYKETFSPVADIRAIGILICITTFYDYEIWQMDVKTAFLNDYLDEDIYMVQPEGVGIKKHFHKLAYKKAFLERNREYFGSKIVDLRELAVEKGYFDNIERVGMPKLAKEVLGKILEKDEEVRTSMWHKTLSDRQVTYASIDAYLSFEIGRALLDE
uniref:Integrase catalytic domain-containing protein n=1 Tax=Tanacetum cinerariifolium TaxID=118510 RepID=A0A6L2LGF7_TANCI|nr:hypothetical protein [Tanacetum cinerariifolium]